MDLMCVRRGAVLHLTIHRPEKANTLTVALRDGLCAALREAEHDPATGCVLLDAAPGAAFCGGVDLSNPDGLGSVALAERRASIVFDIVRAMMDFPKPLVAAVGGAAVGGGCIVALLVDRIVCTREARLSLPEIRLGMPSFVAAEIVAHRLGGGQARAMALLGDAVDGSALQYHGAMLVDDAPLAPAALQEAQRLAALPPKAFSTLKGWMREPLRFRLMQAMEKTRTRNARSDTHEEVSAAVRDVLG